MEQVRERGWERENDRTRETDRVIKKERERACLSDSSQLVVE